MKVQNITDIEGFFKAIDSCKGKVELVTGEGDRLNLKSKLSQYVSLATIFSNGEIPEMEIIAHEKEDIDRLISYMIRENEVLMRVLALAGEKVCQRFLFYLYQSSKNVPRHILYYMRR